MLKVICIACILIPSLLGDKLDSSHVTFHSGYRYDYFYTAETEIMGMDNITTEIQVSEMTRR